MPEAYGVITLMYSYVAFLMIVLTYGFETAFFVSQATKKIDQTFTQRHSSLCFSVRLLSFDLLIFLNPLPIKYAIPTMPNISFGLL